MKRSGPPFRPALPPEGTKGLSLKPFKHPRHSVLPLEAVVGKADHEGDGSFDPTSSQSYQLPSAVDDTLPPAPSQPRKKRITSERITSMPCSSNIPLLSKFKPPTRLPDVAVLLANDAHSPAAPVVTTNSSPKVCSPRLTRSSSRARAGDDRKDAPSEGPSTEWLPAAHAGLTSPVLNEDDGDGGIYGMIESGQRWLSMPCTPAITSPASSQLLSPSLSVRLLSNPRSSPEIVFSTNTYVLSAGISDVVSDVDVSPVRDGSLQPQQLFLDSYCTGVHTEGDYGCLPAHPYGFEGMLAPALPSQVCTPVLSASPLTSTPQRFTSAPALPTLRSLLSGLPRIADAYARRGISDLYPWQAECFLHEGVLFGQNFLYSAPTSGGKTLIAEVRF
jgi:hypothetical protein